MYFPLNLISWFLFNLYVSLSLSLPVKECVNNLSQEDDKEQLVSSLWGAERCLRVLDSVRLTPQHACILMLYSKLNHKGPRLRLTKP